jgi:hypothetical protein
MQRIACALIGAALFVVCCLVALLLGDALSPGRVAPMLAFYAACGAGVSLILGLAMLERRGARTAWQPSRGAEQRRGRPGPGSTFPGRNKPPARICARMSRSASPVTRLRKWCKCCTWCGMMPSETPPRAELWSMEDVVARLDAREAPAAKRGPYKPRASKQRPA